MTMQAQVPQKMSIQGILTDDFGEAYPDDVYTLNFRLYNQEFGGVVAWQESQDVESRSGLFNALLGEINPLDIPFDRPYFLGITVDGGQELEPRIELAATPYSLIARTVAPGGIQPGALSENSVDVNNIVPKIVSSVNGVSSDGGNIQLVAGSNITISPDDVNKTITISASDQSGGNSGILQINGGNAIDVNDNDGPTTTISVANNSINDDEIQNNSISASSLAAGAVGNSEIQDNAVSLNKISTDVISSIDGVRNDGGNVDLVAGTNVTITPNDVNNTITISAINQGGGSGNFTQINPGNAIDVSDIDGPITTISVDQKSIGTNELESEVTFESGGRVDIDNPNGVRVSRLTYDTRSAGFLGLKNRFGADILRLHSRSSDGGALDIYDDQGNTIIELSDNLSGGGYLGMFSSSGSPFVSISPNTFGDGQIQLGNRNASLIADLTATPAGGGLFTLGNAIAVQLQ